MLSFLLPPGRQSLRAIPRPVRVTVKQCYSVQAAVRGLDTQRSVAEVTNEYASTSEPSSSNSGGTPPASNLRNEQVSSEAPISKRASKRQSKKFKKTMEPREPSIPRTQMYLDQLLSEGVDPTVEDLERFRPKHCPDPMLDLPKYKRVYAETFEDLDRAFNRDQIASFVDSILNYPPAARARKNQMIGTIMRKHWDMASPAQVEKERKEQSEIRKQLFPVSKAQLFILLGQDGASFKELANQHRATLFVESSPKLSVRAEATKSDLKVLGQQIEDLTKELVTNDMHLHRPLELGDSIVQSMSRQAGVYMEQINSSTIRLTAQTSEQLQYAQRLVWKAYMKRANLNLLISHGARTEFASPSSYSMYPFASTTPLPWYTGASAGFRPRKTGEWLMGSNMGSISSLNGPGVFSAAIAEEPINLDEVIRSVRTVPSLSEGPLTVTASTGHIIFTDTKPSKFALLTSAVQKGAVAWPMKTPLNWVQHNHQRATYISSLPHPLVGTDPVTPTEFIRLTYSQLDSKKSKWAGGPTPSMSRTLTIELPIRKPPSLVGDWGVSASRKDIKMTVEKVGYIDLVLPDRPTDLQLRINAEDDGTIPSTPSELLQYAEELTSLARPNSGTTLETFAPHSPPSQITIDPNSTLILESAYHVTRSTHRLRSALDNPTTADDWPELGDMLLREKMKKISSASGEDSVEVVVERKQDIESQSVSESCSVQCSSIDDQESWVDFLRSCDLMTTHMYPGVPAGSRSPSLAGVSV